MGTDQPERGVPDLTGGVPLSELPEGEAYLGQLEGDPVILVRRGGDVFGIGASCTHYGGPLAEGLVVGETIRCPWHHACFSLRTGEAIRAPALNPVPCWRVEVRDGKAHLSSKAEAEPLANFGRRASGPESVVIVGAGAAGSAAAEMLRREGYERPITLVDPDQDAPYDRPNLSKDYLAGTALEEWIPLRPKDFHAEHGIGREFASVDSFDSENRSVLLTSGQVLTYGSLLLATGAVPTKLRIPGADLPHVRRLRSLADCRVILQLLEDSRRVVVLGASFIGMEAAASIGSRGKEVTVVAPERVPFEKTFGRKLGTALREIHEENGVVFNLGHTAARIDPESVWLDDGTKLPADLVLVGIGVKPDTRLAEVGGLNVENGVIVDRRMETSAPGVFAAGDIARYPAPFNDERVRVEHWVAAQRQGQTAARSILGQDVSLTVPPFFWTRQWDFGISYVGYGVQWDEIRIDGDIRGRDASIRYLRGGEVCALATVGRDLQSLQQEAATEGARPIGPTVQGSGR